MLPAGRQVWPSRNLLPHNHSPSIFRQLDSQLCCQELFYLMTQNLVYFLHDVVYIYMDL